MNKLLKKILLTLITAIIVIVLGFAFLFRQDIATLMSIEKVDDYGMYVMDYTTDYGLDELIEQGGVSSDPEIAEFVIKKVLKGLPVEFDIPDFGCSTFQVQNAEGDWLFARNYDLSYVPSMIVRTNPENGYASISISNMSVLGYTEDNMPTNLLNSVMTLAAPYVLMDGLNEKGLSIGVLLIKDEPTKQTGNDLDMTTTSAIRYVLDKAANVEEAITLFETMNMHSSSGVTYHFQIADSSGDSAIIEYIDNEIDVIQKGETEKPMALTNFLVSDKNYGFGKGHDRYDIIVDSLEQSNGLMEADQAMEVLQSVSQNTYDPILDEGSTTQWSVVYNNTDLTMDIVAGGQFDKVYSFSLFE